MRAQGLVTLSMCLFCFFLPYIVKLDILFGTHTNGITNRLHLHLCLIVIYHKQILHFINIFVRWHVYGRVVV